MTPEAASPSALPADDLSALSWVHDEVRRTLEVAHKSLRRHLRESDSIAGADVDAVDPAVLRQARAQIHQAAGVLDMIGQPPASALLRASEAAVQRFVAQPSRLDAAAVETIEQASFALLDFVARRLAGREVSPMALFPQYRAVQELAGVASVHPSDLWNDEVPEIDLPGDPQAGTRSVDESFRDDVEAQMLALLRQPRGTAPARLSALFAALGNGEPRPSLATLWRLAAAVFEGQAHGLLPVNVYGKRLVPRLLALLRVCESDPTATGSGAVPSRLRRDLLFFCLQAGPAADAATTPKLAAARRAFGLAGRAGADYEAPQLGRFDPAQLAQARKRVAAAKDAWSAVAGGELDRLATLAEPFALVGDSLRRLFPGGEALAGALDGAAADLAARRAAPSPELAMEVATGMLYVEASLDDADFDHPTLRERIGRLAQRISTVRSGRAAPPLEDWIEDLYRRVSDRQTMGSVVQELRASLADAEKQIDRFFRDPEQRDALAQATAPLQAMRGVLAVLGLDDAMQAVLRMRDDVQALAAGDGGADAVERLTSNLGKLGFLVDLLGVQPPLARALFAFDAGSGTLVSRAAPAAARRGDVAAPPSLAGVAPERPAASAPRSVSGAAPLTLREDFALPELPSLPEQPAAAPAVAPPPIDTPSTLGALSDDDEMREIFLEEARDVSATARAALDVLAASPEDLAELTAVRRAFHTLKGSARMVGLNDFGEAAWACEQLYNARLADAPRADDALLGFSADALAYLGGWIDAIAAGRDAGHRPQPVQHAADALRLHGRREPLPLPGEPAAAAVDTAAAEAIGTVGTVDTAEPAAPLTDLVLSFDDVAEPAAAPTEVPATPAFEFDLDRPIVSAAEAVAIDEAGFDFELDLSMPETPAAPAPEAAATQTAETAGTVEAIDADAFVLPDDVGATLEADAPPPAIETAEVLEAVEALDAVDAAGPVEAADAEPFKVVGPLRIPIPLFNIYLGEADELSRRLCTELAEWALELGRPVGESAVALAHSLAGSSATVGYHDLSQLARALEHALARSHALGHGTAGDAALFEQAADTIRQLLHRFAAGFLPPVPESLLEALAAHERETAQRLQAAPTVEVPADDAELADAAALFEAPEAGVAEEPPAAGGTHALDAIAPVALLDAEPAPAAAAPAWAEAPLAIDEDIDAEDAVDEELFPVFEEEAHDLLPQLAARMREWVHAPHDAAAAAACMRTLHTLKGGARLAGAMRLGEMAHRLEAAIEHLLARGNASAADVERLQGVVDRFGVAFDLLRGARAPEAAPPAAAPGPVVAPVAAPVDEPAPHAPPVTAAAPASGTLIDWSRFGRTGVARTAAGPAAPAPGAGASTAAVRVRVPLLDRLVNHAGEVSITRSRIEADVDQLKSSLADLTDNLERLRRQLRDLELQAETQIASRLEQAKSAAETFDPLEFDRFTRFQELTRMMAESVNDVATVQRSLQRALQSAEDELAAQARLTRDLQADLLRTRMVEFEGLSERLYRVVRQAAKETGKQVRLDIVGGSIEVDRGVLDRMTPAFEHLLRNCVTHGIERPEVRAAAGKDATGHITVMLTHEGNEVGIEFRDDGAGLNLARIRERALAAGLLAPGAQPSDDELTQLIYAPGLSTAEQVTELAGRGVGMDVVRSDVVAMGGRIETATTPGHGTAFRLVLPLTTAVTQVVMLRCGDTSVAVPSTLVESVRRTTAEELDAAHASGTIAVGDDVLPLYWLGALLELSAGSCEPGRSAAIVIVRSARQRVAIQVDEVLGRQEVVVKNLGPQLSRLPGLAGMTLLPSGQPALIYNPVALAALYGPKARELAREAPPAVDAGAAAEPELAPLVLVVDDSLTVRRVTQRLLAREGYRVALAKDGLEALERLAEERPAVVLSDIEMPRMDGFDLVRNIRGDDRWRSLPVIMITSRIAQKHREVAMQLGVDHYLGKPYSEEDLLALIARYAGRLAAAAA